jgi:peroxiredoxin Q/BCP
MKRLLFAALCSAGVAVPAFAALTAGDVAPSFEARASLNGKDFDYSLSGALKKGPVVVYFYPSAYTQGCDVEAHRFSETIERFRAAGASVIGVSLDSIERLNDFSADPDYCAGKFPVASDPDGSIARSFALQIREGREGLKDVRGVEIGHGFAERTTFIVRADGKIAATIGGMGPEENVMKSLEVVQGLH